jgi:hypothetical protein
MAVRPYLEEVMREGDQGERERDRESDAEVSRSCQILDYCVSIM